MKYFFGESSRTKRHLWYERTMGVGIGTAVVCALLTWFVLIDGWKRVGWSSLQRKYWRQYLFAAENVGQKSPGTYEFLLLERPRSGPVPKSGSGPPVEQKLATEDTLDADGRTLLASLYADGWRLHRETKTMAHEDAYRLMRQGIFADRRPRDMVKPAWIAGGSIWFCLLVLLTAWDVADRRAAKTKKTLRGTIELEPEALNKAVKGDGMGIPFVTWKRLLGVPYRKLEGFMRIRKSDEEEHFMVVADTRQGKTVLFKHMLSQVLKKRIRNLVYDPTLQFWEQFANRENGDVMLHPLYKNCPYWDLAGEIKTELDAIELASSFLPDKDEGRQDFWDLAPKRLLAFLLMKMKEQGAGIERLLFWLKHPDWIDALVMGTDLEPLIDKKAAGQRAGVNASLSMIADALRMLPPDDGRPRFTFKAWAKAGNFNVFIGNRPSERRALKPLVSAWIDTAIRELMVRPGGRQTYLWLDELPTLQKLPKISDAATEAGKYNLVLVWAFQGRAQLEKLYGKIAETLMSSPGVRIFLRTKEYSAAEWIANNIARNELETEQSGVTASVGEGRDSVNYRDETKVEHLVLPVEIQNLKKLSGYLRYDQYVVKFRFEPLPLPTRNEFEERSIQYVLAEPLEAPEAAAEPQSAPKPGRSSKRQEVELAERFLEPEFDEDNGYPPPDEMEPAEEFNRTATDYGNETL